MAVDFHTALGARAAVEEIADAVGIRVHGRQQFGVATRIIRASGGRLGLGAQFAKANAEAKEAARERVARKCPA